MKSNSLRLLNFKLLSIIVVLIVNLIWIGYALTSINLRNSALESQIVQIITHHPDIVLSSVRDYQQEQQKIREQAVEALRKTLVSAPRELIGKSPTTGSQKLNLVLVEFADFQCPFCGKMGKTLKQFMAAHGEEVTLVYKHFPLEDIHSEAMPAALAAWAADQQGKFWEFQNALFENQGKLGEAFYIKTAKHLRLNMKQFDRDRHSDEAKTAIQQDIDLAKNLGIDGTPHFLLNETSKSGILSLEELDQALLQAKQDLVQSGSNAA